MEEAAEDLHHGIPLYVLHINCRCKKVNNYQKTLAGAKFRLYSDEACQNEVYVRKEKMGTQL